MATPGGEECIRLCPWLIAVFSPDHNSSSLLTRNSFKYAQIQQKTLRNDKTHSVAELCMVEITAQFNVILGEISEVGIYLGDIRQ